MTQVTVGLREVNEKRRQWQNIPDKKRAEFLGRHMIPAVIGPKKRDYAIDHHHEARALHDEGVKNVLVFTIKDLSCLEWDQFWIVMEHHGWVHPYGADGRRCDYRDIPKSASGLIDDPFRSLAGELRRAGGFAKDTTPFSEFLWADFLRGQIKRKIVEKDFSAALKIASKLAKSSEAKYLPGWCGPTDDTAR
jgi:hypothetical protein